MNISNSYQNFNSYKNTNTEKINKTSSTSFQERFEKNTQENSSRKKVYEDGMMVKLWEKHKNFENISDEDLKLFKDILWDNYISTSEVKSIPYDKLEAFNEFISFPEGIDIGSLPLFFSNKSLILAQTVSHTKDEVFNKALYYTYKELPFNDITDLSLETDHIIEQAKRGQNISLSFATDLNAMYRTNKKVSENEIDFQNLLVEILKQTKKIINNSSLNNEFKKQVIKVDRLFSTLYDNYKKVKEEKLSAD